MTQQTKKYYKIVRILPDNSNTLYSFNYYDLLAFNEDMPVVYTPGQWVYPKVKYTDLMVFSNLINVRNFIDRFALRGVKLYECQVKNPRRIGLFVLPCYGWITKLRESVDKRSQRKAYLKISEYTHCPSGTVFCSAVKLIKEIDFYGKEVL